MIQNTPKGLRLQIGFFGRRNAGKSSLLNALAGQDVVIPLKKGLETAELNVIMQPDARGHILLANIVYLLQGNASDDETNK